MMVRVFRHHISLYAILLATLEVSFFILGGLFLIGFVPGAVALNYHGVDRDFLVGSLSLAIFVTVCSVGFYNRRATLRSELRVVQWGAVFLLVSAVLGGVFLVYWWMFGQTETFPFGLWGTTVLVYVLAALVARFFFEYVIRDRAVLKKRIIVLGAGPQAERVFRTAQNDPQCLFEVVGFLRCSDGDEPTTVAPLLADEMRTERYALADFAAANDVDEIVVTIRDRRRPPGKLGNGLPIWEMMDCKLRGVRVTEFPTFWERELGRVDLESIRPSWIIFSDGFDVSIAKRIFKRSFDLFFSSLFVLITLPIMIVTAIAVKLDSRGPVFYSQERVGRDGKLFKIRKFRSMRTDAEAKGAVWAQKNDDRVTRVGKFIRKTRIDEIPQILNVLNGDMSFVGPRPERPVFVSDLEEKIPYYKERHRIKPGITGWAQINYPYGATLDDACQKHTFDLYYMKNIGLFLDLVILMQTVRVVLFGEGAR